MKKKEKEAVVVAVVLLILLLLLWPRGFTPGGTTTSTSTTTTSSRTTTTGTISGAFMLSVSCSAPAPVDGYNLAPYMINCSATPSGGVAPYSYVWHLCNTGISCSIASTTSTFSATFSANCYDGSLDVTDAENLTVVWYGLSVCVSNGISFSILVLTQSTGSPIAGAKVAYGSFVIYTDQNGAASFVNVPNSDSLTVSANGYLPRSIATFSPTPGSTYPIQLAGG